jgi:uncharacterized MAPEG superfamily protein
MDLFHTPAFGMYALFAAALSVLLITIDGAGGGVRAGTKTTPNPEDLGSTTKGGTVVEQDPERVARVMRAHRNAMANIIPFLFVMFLFVALGASTQWVLILCGIFTFARVTHAIVYIKGLQPWRSIAFGIGQICTGIAVVMVVRAAIAFV